VTSKSTDSSAQRIATLNALRARRPVCGVVGLRLLATIEERAVVAQLLTHLGSPVDLPQPSPARTPAWLPGVRDAADHEPDPGGHRAN